MIEKNSKSSKKKLIIIIAIVLLIISILSLGIYLFIEHNKKVPPTEEELQAIIKNYGDIATNVSDLYSTNHNEDIPIWSDIVEDIDYKEHQVSCESKVNYDGSIYLKNCVVDEYTSSYEYGEDLTEPVTSEKKLYIYSYDEYFRFDTSYKKTSLISQYTVRESEFVDEYDQYDNEELIKIYNCKSDNCVGYDHNSVDNTILIYDNNRFYNYNYLTGKKETLLLDVDPENVKTISYITDDNKAYGLNVRTKGPDKFYNLDLKKYTYETTKGSIGSLGGNLLKDNYLIEEVLTEPYKNGITILFNLVTGEVVKELPGVHIDKILKFNSSDKWYYVVNENYWDWPYLKLLDENLNFVSDNNGKFYDDIVINSDDSITCEIYNSDSQNGHKYILYKNNEIVYESKEYKDIKIIEDYILVVDTDNILKVLDLYGNVKASFDEVKKYYGFHSALSGWYNKDGKIGIYLIVSKDPSPDPKPNGYEYYYIPETNETGVIETNVPGYAKPVLYLYPEKETEVTVKFEHPDLLTTTYPKFKDSWTVKAHPNGDLYDKDMKYYYGLYWEESGSTEVDFKTGFYVTKENALEFLEEKTAQIGLTRREANEFIMYWLPILEKNEKNLVYFELTEEREAYNKLFINPNPDSLLRVAIHIKKVNEPTIVKPQKITPFNRVGFTMVEWGGVQH